MSTGKRTRRTVYSDSDAEETAAAKQKETRANSKRARRSVTEEIDEFPDDMNVEDEDFEEEFDKEAAEELEKIRLRRRSSAGATAESGVIESIELVNFMCHKFLKVAFGPKINFIIGHNGSGKSAILTGITVCLGGKANVTNRASNLKSLIREGASVGQVTLKLRNRGADAYRPETYGDSIIIERRISHDGSNGYKIKTHEGKLVSGKRDELNAILDHMAIQVDNPLNVLSQDTARQFLQSSSSEDKYKFFMKGTQLTQLSEDYELIRESIEITLNIIKHKKEVLPDLHKQAKEAEARYQDIQKARELGLRVSSLKDQMAWAQVEEKEKEVSAAEADLKKAKKRVLTVQKNLEKEQAQLDDINAAISTLEEQYNEHVGITKPLQDRKKELNKIIKENADQLREISTDERDVNDNIINLKKSIEKYQEKINEEALKLREDNRQKRDDILNAIRVREEEINRITCRNRELQTRLENLHDKKEHIRNERRSMEIRARSTREEIERYENLKQQLIDQKSNHLRVFGSSIPEVLEAIDRFNHWKKKPVGPFGRYIKLLKPKWSNTLESVIGNSLTAFSVQDYHDQQVLSKIMADFKCNSPIIVGEYDKFDYSSGEPSDEFLTILRVLQIDDENIKRQLINQYRIESIILVERRDEADKIMHNSGRGFPHNVDGCYTMDGYKVGHRGGGFLTQSIRAYRGPARFTPDVDSQIRDAERMRKEASTMHFRYVSELEKADQELKNVQVEQQKIHAEIAENQHQGRSLNEEIIQYKEKLQEDESASITALEDAIQEAEQHIKMSKKNYAALQENKVRINQSQLPLVTEIEKVGRRLISMSDESRVINEQLEEQVGLRVTHANNKEHWVKKLAIEQQKVDVVEEELRKRKCELEDWTKQAEDYCPERVEVTKSAHELDREIKQIQNRLREREKEQGFSLEEIASDVTAKCESYRRAKREIAHMEQFIKDLKEALQTRMKKWRNFRTYISIRARWQFLFQLTKRGYAGKLLFDHPNKTLKIRVQVDEQLNQGSDKDPKSLSGGEKSFSTICFLLSLWEAMGCPIRCLDEFDVFMDAVNRRISMKMMIETARESDCTQYILITPQDASSVSPGPDVRVHRLQDPERGQGIIEPEEM
ncbi:10002_t:CDS:10 [Acaulospora morrowiae]|uniref:10002_t:CDS:1 n=1 Tax=Acaulospora morrowiae TaxID=94023 RepID=A0A9N9GB64_9GLOM|nr:10002_t:CDS:10 [Acaulospora morrowiae]